MELLQERQPLWVAWLAEQEEKMEAEWVGPLAQLSGEASRLQQLIAQMERKCRQPDWEFLQVGGALAGLKGAGNRGSPVETLATFARAGTHFSALLFQDIQDTVYR